MRKAGRWPPLEAIQTALERKGIVFLTANEHKRRGPGIGWNEK
jgi:hypothetical protein